MHICTAKSVLEAIDQGILPLANSFKEKALEFENVVKIGRTHCQDAVPMFWKDEFLAYSKTLKDSIESIRRGLKCLEEIPIGGTAIGTGINTFKEYPQIICDEINNILNCSFF